MTLDDETKEGIKEEVANFAAIVSHYYTQEALQHLLMFGEVVVRTQLKEAS